VHITELGEGQPVLFIHGGLMNGDEAWVAQRPLADHYRLLFMDRFSYGDSADRLDDVRIQADIDAIAALATGGVHLVGHSYGALLCLLAAAHRSAPVLSLAVIEPPAFALARGDPHVEALVDRLGPVLLAAKGQSPAAAMESFFAALGLVEKAPLTPRIERAVRATFREPPPWELDVDLTVLAAARFPILVVSGGWAGDDSYPVRHGSGSAFETVCDRLAQRLHAERAVIPGAAHAVQFTGEPFNNLLDSFMGRATRSAGR